MSDFGPFSSIKGSDNTVLVPRLLNVTAHVTIAKVHVNLHHSFLTSVTEPRRKLICKLMGHKFINIL